MLCPWCHHINMTLCEKIKNVLQIVILLCFCNKVLLLRQQNFVSFVKFSNCENHKGESLQAIWYSVQQVKHLKMRFVVKETQKKSITSWELPRPFAVSMYKCLPRILTRILMCRLTVVVHNESTLLVKPMKGQQTLHIARVRRQGGLKPYIAQRQRCLKAECKALLLRIFRWSHSSCISELDHVNRFRKQNRFLSRKLTDGKSDSSYLGLEELIIFRFIAEFHFEIGEPFFMSTIEFIQQIATTAQNACSYQSLPPLPSPEIPFKR